MRNGLGRGQDRRVNAVHAHLRAYLRDVVAVPGGALERERRTVPDLDPVADVQPWSSLAGAERM